MQLVSNKPSASVWPETRSMTGLGKGERGILKRMDLPEDVAYRLMLLGFVPGAEVECSGCAPGGDPKLFRVDGTEVALRGETAKQMILDSL